jgi:hypothetical protein
MGGMPRKSGENTEIKGEQTPSELAGGAAIPNKSTLEDTWKFDVYVLATSSGLLAPPRLG